MAYRNVVYNRQQNCMTLFTWDEAGRRVQYNCSYSPYLYVESLSGEATSIFGTKLKKKIFRNGYERYKFTRESNIKRVFENIQAEQQFLLDTYWRNNESDDFSKHDIKYCFIDIETYSPTSFPNIDNPQDTVNVITAWNNIDKTFYTFGLKPYTGSGRSDLKYQYCKTERDLFLAFLDYLEKDYPDIISGYNSELFDIPYIINRMEKVLGEGDVTRLSPLRNVHTRIRRGMFGKEQKRYFLDGMSSIDYLDIYKRFCLKLRESYKLDAIAEIELGEKKIDHGGQSLWSLADNDWNTFIDYNIQDVNLLVRLEEKLQYIPLLRMLAYIGLTTFEGAMGTIQVINGALCIRARSRNQVIPTFIRKDKDHKNPGAYVAEPKPGFKKNIVSFDANSLYPNVMISLNTSPETKVGKITNICDTSVTIQHVSGKVFELSNQDFATFVKREKIAISKARVLFTQKVKGILPEFLEYYYGKRVKIRKELHSTKLQYEKDSTNTNLSDEIKRLNTKQLVVKILINSAYGYTGNKKAPIGDDDIAASVTLTGQSVIKQAGDLIQKYLKTQYNITDKQALEDSWIYSDTDSCYFTLQSIQHILDIKGNVIPQAFYNEVNNIEKYLNKAINKWACIKLKTIDPRFIFKRECISDAGIFLQKKRYVMRVLDDENIKCNKFKYVGVEVVRTTMPNAIKPYAKKIIETFLLTQSQQETNSVLNEAYEKMKTLNPEEMAFVMGVNGYEKYAQQCNDFNLPKRMPIHVKAAYHYNLLLNKLGISNKYEAISSGDKVRYMYVTSPNKYNLSCIGFKYEYPAEFNEIFTPDYEKMFSSILYNSIGRFYDNVGWVIRKPTENVKVELIDLFGK